MSVLPGPEPTPLYAGRRGESKRTARRAAVGDDPGERLTRVVTDRGSPKRSVIERAVAEADVELDVGVAVRLEQLAGRLPGLRGVVRLQPDRQLRLLVDVHQRPVRVPVGVRAAGVD